MESYYQRSPMRASQVRGNTWRLSKQEHKNAVCGVCVCVVIRFISIRANLLDVSVRALGSETAFA